MSERPDERSNYEIRAEALREGKAFESRRAQTLLDSFTAAALAQSLPAERLRVRGYGGKGSASSNVIGWYVRHDHSMGVGTDGKLYRLAVPLGIMERLRGVTLRPMDPPMVLGAGGRDGDSIDLVDALKRLLPEWDAPQV